MIQKKSLGQNFLRSKPALAKIAEAGNLKADDVVLEVGPGEGVLTAELLARAGKVVAVEKDDRLIPLLREKFAKEISAGKFELIHADILDLSSSDYQLKAISYKLVANIPYYITGQLIRKFLEAEKQPSDMVILVQKEVAKRIAAKDGKESLLSISVKAYGTPKLVATVPAGSFVPAPNVDSAILSINDISKKFFADCSRVELPQSDAVRGASEVRDQNVSLYIAGANERSNEEMRRLRKLYEEKFFKVLKAGFAHKRKKLAGNLKPIYPDIENVLEKIGVDKNARAENLTLEKWRLLASALSDI